MYASGAALLPERFTDAPRKVDIKGRPQRSGAREARCRGAVSPLFVSAASAGVVRQGKEEADDAGAVEDSQAVPRTPFFRVSEVQHESDQALENLPDHHCTAHGQQTKV